MDALFQGFCLQRLQCAQTWSGPWPQCKHAETAAGAQLHISYSQGAKVDQEMGLQGLRPTGHPVSRMFPPVKFEHEQKYLRNCLMSIRLGQCQMPMLLDCFHLMLTFYWKV